MAILMRGGAYADFDPSKLNPREWAVVLEDDPSAKDGKAIYICFAAGNVKRISTYEDMADDLLTATDDIKQQYITAFNEIKTEIEGIRDETETFKNTAVTKANESELSSQSASASAGVATQKSSEASQSAINSADSADDSEEYSNYSKSYAIGTEGEVREGDETDNSKYYYEQSKNIYDNFSQAGTVTGVKGNKENTYRTGNVNLTPEDIGAVSVEDIINNLTTTEAGQGALDAYQGYLLDQKIEDLKAFNNSNLQLEDCTEGKIITTGTDIPVNHYTYWYYDIMENIKIAMIIGGLEFNSKSVNFIPTNELKKGLYIVCNTLGVSRLFTKTPFSDTNREAAYIYGNSFSLRARVYVGNTLSENTIDILHEVPFENIGMQYRSEGAPFGDNPNWPLLSYFANCYILLYVKEDIVSDDDDISIKVEYWFHGGRAPYNSTVKASDIGYYGKTIECLHGIKIDNIYKIKG